MEELHAARQLNSSGVMHKAGSLVINIVITLMVLVREETKSIGSYLQDSHTHAEIGGVECFILLKDEEARVFERFVKIR